MKVREYLLKLKEYSDVTFIKARARKDAHTPYYHPEYQTTPFWSAKTWLSDSNEKLMDSIVLNDKQMPIDWLSGFTWSGKVSSGDLKCLLVVGQEDFKLLYKSKEQRDSMEAYIEEKLDVK